MVIPEGGEVVVAVSTFSLRWWRLLRLGRNPLVRSWDRVETAVLVVIVLVVLVATPFVGLLGSNLYARQRAEVAVQTATRHETTATLLADAPPQTASAQGVSTAGTPRVAAVWSLPDRSQRTGTVPADKGAKAGSTVRVWLDENGNPTGAPITTEIAAMNGITVAVLAWLGIGAVGAAAFSVVRWALDRRRYAQWDSEWERIATNRSHS